MKAAEIADEELEEKEFELTPTVQLKQYQTKVNGIRLGMTFVCGLLAWDYFAEAADISDAIKSYEDLGLSTKKLESQKNRKVLCGVVFSGVAVGFAISCFEKVEIQATPSSLSLNYKF